METEAKEKKVKRDDAIQLNMEKNLIGLTIAKVNYKEKWIELSNGKKLILTRPVMKAI